MILDFPINVLIGKLGILNGTLCILSIHIFSMLFCANDLASLVFNLINHRMKRLYYYVLSKQVYIYNNNTLKSLTV